MFALRPKTSLEFLSVSLLETILALPIKLLSPSSLLNLKPPETHLNFLQMNRLVYDLSGKQTLSTRKLLRPLQKQYPLNLLRASCGLRCSSL